MLKTHKLRKELQSAYALHRDIATNHLELALALEAGTADTTLTNKDECWETFHTHNIITTVIGSIMENNKIPVPDDWGYKSMTWNEIEQPSLSLDKFI